ncbi:MAG TPA: RNA polymerase factor sigma-54 [Fimbriimonadales bacterium]|nr:RNA polymerase factor sigma-54 [Fimbriimonadales bacterium]
MALHQETSQKTKTEVRTQLHVDPRVIVSAKILELPLCELEVAVEQELSDNPALEREESAKEIVKEEEEIFKKFYKSRNEPREEEQFFETENNADWTDFIPSKVSLHDYLLAQLLPIVKPHQKELAKFIVHSVNEQGYLEIPDEEIAYLCGSDLDEVREVIEKLQSCEPTGVGARDLKECLLLQLRATRDEVSELACSIVQNHWDSVLRRRTTGIARSYGVSKGAVERAFELITSLSPYPGETFGGELNLTSYRATPSITADVVYHRDETGIQIEVRGCDPSEFFINPQYRARYLQIRSQSSRITPEEKTHVKEYVNRAVTFVKSLKQRKITLMKIAMYLLKEQGGFITTGSYHFLKPLTRLQIARALGMHESTVCRATMNKYVQLVNKDVVSFDFFFKPALRIQKLIEEILQNENPNHPLSDREISEILKRQGVHVARRTVSKYREQIRMLSSFHRRSA